MVEKIGGWGRIAVLIGVVLSIAWMGAMLVQGSDRMRAQRFAIADESKKTCEKKSEKTGEDCSGVWMRAYFAAEQLDRDRPALLQPGMLEALLPVLAGWLIVFGAISAFRWVVEGFRKNPTQR